MTALTVIYTRSHSLLGLLVRHHERFGKWSHAAVLNTPHTVVEATWPGGVRQLTVGKFFKRFPTYKVVQYDVPNPEAALQFVQAQLGKPYDWKAVLGRFFRTSWQDTKAWQCAELVEATLTAGGLKRFRDSPFRITPNASYSVLP